MKYTVYIALMFSGKLKIVGVSVSMLQYACVCGQGISTCAQVIRLSGPLSLIDNRRVLMFKVCGKVPQYRTADRRELAAELTPRIETPPLARHHTLTHALRSQAELSCFNTDLLPAVEETVHRYEIVAS